MIEFALILPIFMILLLGTLEFGEAFSHHLTIEYATREGARSGSALANGGGQLGCGTGQSPSASIVDPLIIQAVERVLKSSGSPIVLANVTQIRIFKSTATGAEMGPVNVWTYTPNTGPIPSGSATHLDFSPSAVGWSVCSRTFANPADNLGVSITYNYGFQTGLGSLMRIISTTSTGPTLTITDQTVMSVNPTGQ